MIDISEAYPILFSHIQASVTVEVPIDQALHRMLAVPIRCDLDDPPFDRSSMDGFAVRASDVVDAPVTLRVVGQVAAGSTADRTLGRGEAIQINTGAPVPPGANAVVRVEETEADASRCEVLVRQSVPSGKFITRQGTYVRAGQTVLSRGTLLTPLEIAVAAASGAGHLSVYRRPSVAILTTGDELVEVNQKPTGARIRNSNQHLLKALTESAHADPVVLGVAGDDHDLLRNKIEEGLACDVLCVTGGVSMGTFDFVPEVLEQCGATIHIRKLAIKPGRPIHFATMPDGTLIFALPGNPISALIGFELLVRPALAALQGREELIPTPINARLSGSIGATSGRQSYLPGKAGATPDGEWEVEPLCWHGSGDVFGMATANALVVRPPGSKAAESGAVVSILLLERG